MSSAIIQDIIFLVCVIGLGAPIGKLAYKIMEGGKIKFLGFLRPVELCVYRAKMCIRDRFYCIMDFINLLLRGALCIR